jgi:hypothetical protein
VIGVESSPGSNIISSFLNSSYLIVFGLFFIGTIMTTGLLVLIKQLKHAQVSQYEATKKMTVLSEVRSSYENQIARLTEEMMANRVRWAEVNHLIMDGQKRLPSKEDTSVQRSIANAFGIQNIPKIDPRLVFFLTPFTNEEQETYQTVKKVCEIGGLRCLRGDETNVPFNILSHIVRSMLESRLIIANISSRNPNVMYELGIAHSIGKPVVVISRTLGDIPFDVSTTRIVTYQDLSQLQSVLLPAITGAITNEQPV